MKTFKVSFKGRIRKSKSPYSKKTVTIQLENKPDEMTGVLPELNKCYEVWEIFEIWEKIY